MLRITGDRGFVRAHRESVPPLSIRHYILATPAMRPALGAHRL
jgi:hypothetical protein